MSHPDDGLAAHRDFLNTYDGASRRSYDLTRQYYLFGRDGVLRALAGEAWSRLGEVGPGTGRILRLLRRMRPDAELGAIEASDAMLEHARTRCPDVSFVQGFAERADYAAPLGAPPERVLFSYCLSMVPNKREALERAMGALAPGGEVVVVDFSDLEGLPSPLAAALRAWLRAFHVEPIEDALLEEFGARLTHGPLRYCVVGRIGA